MSEMRASVLIPVKNGGRLLRDVLAAVLAQQTPWAFEVLVVDSGSSDGSVETVLEFGIRCESIAPESFGHGRTRNHLANLAGGEFLVFITQDAKPASKDWLRLLVDGCDMAPDVAGAFGPHLAYPQARPVTRRELAQHFAGFGPEASIARLDDRNRFETDPGYRQWLHFFSSNNACIRKSVWSKIPLPDVDFAEDQTWALRIVEAGYAKAYVPQAAVFHSHDFGIWETLQRNFDESRCFAKYFGYRLRSSLLRTFAAGFSLAGRDASWLREFGLSYFNFIKAATYMAMIELSRVMGQYFGAHYERLPSVMLKYISRDEKLQRKVKG